MTYAEALVYAAAFATNPQQGKFPGHAAVKYLRGELPFYEEGYEALDAACDAMLDEFRAFDPRGNPDGK